LNTLEKEFTPFSSFLPRSGFVQQSHKVGLQFGCAPVLAGYAES
jgi:hypothetical protein